MNKNRALMIIGLVFTIFLANLALASLEIVETDLTAAVTYEDLEDNDDQVNFENTITILNTGNTTENITLTLQNLITNYDLTVSPTSLEIAAGASSEVKVSGKIPVNVDQGVSEFGTLKIGGTSTEEFKLKTDVQSMLEIKKINVYVNGERVKSITENAETVKELGPGDQVELKFQLNNLFDEDYDEGDITGEVSIELDDNNFGERINEDQEFDIEAGAVLESADDEVVFAFTIPKTIEEDDQYKLEITVTGKDGNKARYEVRWDLNLEVERAQDDVRIEKLSVSPEELTCTRELQFVIGVTNFGSDEQKHAALSVINSDLGINENFQFELDRGITDDNSVLRQFPIVLKEDLVPGIYPIVVSAFYDYNTLDDKQIIKLVVSECPTNGAEETVPVVEEEEKETVTEAITSSFVVKSIEKIPYTAEDFMVALIVVAIVIIFILILVLLITLFK
ncbi:MAG: hypothetical protein AABW48_03185 [Nanoarchaeota archaeon]